MEQKPAATWRFLSASALISWLSVCLLAGAYGHTLDARWQAIWAEMGMLGLAAGLGLGSIDRFRQARLTRLRELALQSRLEFGLNRLHQDSATIDSINAAVRMLAHQASVDMRGKLGMAQRNHRRDQMQLLTDYPLQIIPVIEDHETSTLLSPVEGTLQQISSRVISFEHEEPIPTRTVLLTFHIGEKHLSFVVDVNWTQKVDGTYSSGGTVLVVGVPSDEEQPEAVGV